MKVFLPEYLEMCEKAEELQNNWIPQEGHYCCKKGRSNEKTISFISEKLMNESRAEYRNFIWIPASGQLIRHLSEAQNWVRNHYDNFCNSLYKNKNLPDHFKRDENIRDLMWHMDIEYAKKWDFKKEEWVSI